jgi:hypothetical protein
MLEPHGMGDSKKRLCVGLWCRACTDCCCSLFLQSRRLNLHAIVKDSPKVIDFCILNEVRDHAKETSQRRAINRSQTAVILSVFCIRRTEEHYEEWASTSGPCQVSAFLNLNGRNSWEPAGVGRRACIVDLLWKSFPSLGITLKVRNNGVCVDGCVVHEHRKIQVNQ